MCMCASAGSARHRRAPYTVTMTTSKTRHLSLNRPDTHVHDTHKYKTIRQAGRHKTIGHVEKQTHTYSANRKQKASTEMQTDKKKQDKAQQKGRIRNNCSADR